MKLTYHDSRNSVLLGPHDMKAVVFWGGGPLRLWYGLLS